MWAKEQVVELEKLKRQAENNDDNNDSPRDGGDASPDLVSTLERALYLLQGYSKVCHVSM